MAIDLKQLAARLGLSPTTVSRALNGYTDVSEVTRKRVAQVAQELGYQPNLAARRLALGRADAVGIVYSLAADYLGNPAFLETLSGLSSRLSDANVDLLLAAAVEGAGAEMRTYDRLVRGRRVDGLIVAHTRVHDARIDYMIASGLPFVAYGRTAQSENFAWLDFDNQAATRLAVRELAALGHRRIGYVHAPLHYNFGMQRHAGYLKAMHEAGLPVDQRAVVEGSMERRAGYAAGIHLLSLSDRPTAIIADNNLGTIGVLRALLDRGVTIGREVSVVGFDVLPPDTLLNLQVAVVELPTPYQSGHTMGEMILALIEGKTPPQRHVLRQPRYVAGESAGSPSLH